jgi:hypothetical protein
MGCSEAPAQQPAGAELYMLLVGHSFTSSGLIRWLSPNLLSGLLIRDLATCGLWYTSLRPHEQDQSLAGVKTNQSSDFRLLAKVGST